MKNITKMGENYYASAWLVTSTYFLKLGFMFFFVRRRVMLQAHPRISQIQISLMTKGTNEQRFT